MPVSSDVKELFEYINRYKPQTIGLETKLKPFIPDFIPAVGEVDAFLKMPKPDGNKEDLGITVLDEPALNHEDKTVLELKYVQSKNVVRAAPLSVDSIENADKKPKEITRWINSVQDLHKTRPPPTVNYTKNMPIALKTPKGGQTASQSSILGDVTEVSCSSSFKPFR